MKPKILCSFSAGESSAFMTQWLLKHRQDADIIFVFANTGEENEETLIFADQCDKAFNLNLIWVEAVVNPEKQKGTKHKIVDFETAHRGGDVFESVIKKYGIPNKSYPHCNRELKLQPITSYVRSIGWKEGDYKTAIGIRSDETDRVNENYKELNLYYPLISDTDMTKKKVNWFWNNQSFRLELKGYQGNCKWCWKKTLRKHITLAKENPEYYDFPKQMELKYENHDPRHNEGKGTPYRFFRGNLSVEEIFSIADDYKGKLADDDSINYNYQESLFGVPLDASNGCEESCEMI